MQSFPGAFFERNVLYVTFISSSEVEVIWSCFSFSSSISFSRRWMLAMCWKLALLKFGLHWFCISSANASVFSSVVSAVPWGHQIGGSGALCLRSNFAVRQNVCWILRNCLELCSIFHCGDFARRFWLFGPVVCILFCVPDLMCTAIVF